MLPDVRVTLLNGSIGTVSGNTDEVSALVFTGVATSELPLSTPKVIYALSDAEALGITETAMPGAWRQIKEYFDGFRFITGRDVAELYIMTVPNTVTLTQMADYTEASGAKKLMDYAGGRPVRLGLCRTPAGGYTPVLTGGIDSDCFTAIQKAQDMGNTYATKQQPFRVLVEGRGFLLANVGSLTSLHTYDYNRAGIVLFSTKNDGSASVGMVLGIKAGLPVHRKISRVRNKALPVSAVYIGDTAVSLNLGAITTIHDKGYIIGRKFATRAGYYLNGDFMATALTDDYALMCRGEVIDKAQRITYDTYLEEVEEDVDIDPDSGFWIDGYVDNLKNNIAKAIINGMGANISGIGKINIPPHDVFADPQTTIELGLTPKGYNTNINVKLGFFNPAQAN